MSTYLIRLKGQNFLVDGDEGPRKKRFYMTRLVEAENPKRAETLALEMVSTDHSLQKLGTERSIRPTNSLH
jgi:hypothetical protein